jgi:hypothetical protein
MISEREREGREAQTMATLGWKVSHQVLRSRLKKARQLVTQATAMANATKRSTVSVHSDVWQLVHDLDQRVTERGGSLFVLDGVTVRATPGVQWNG